MTNSAKDTMDAKIERFLDMDLGAPPKNEAVERAEKLNKDIEDWLAREVVMTLARGNLVLQSGSYLTEADLEADREFMRVYKFRYLKPEP